MTTAPESSRLDYLDATRAFALVLGVVFHASLSFSPVFMGWAVMDVSTSPLITGFIAVSHAFRMETFFLLAGFFAQGAVRRKGAGAFLAGRAIRIGVPFVAGWFLLRPLLVSGWIMGAASLRGDYAFWPSVRGGFASLETLPAGLFTGSHLWFLYYLALITALALGGRALLGLAGARSRAVLHAADRGIAWLVSSRLALPRLAVPTAVALWFMRGWGMDTPDQSLWPQWAVVAVYGGFFGFGWLLGRQRDALDRFTTLSAVRLVLAAAGVTGVLLLNPFQLDAGAPHRTAAHVAFAACYALTMWSLVGLTIGLFRKLCRQPRAWIRYIADSSYWMYLVHLPIVVWLQVALAENSASWLPKLIVVTTATIALCLLSYDILVRPTWLGWVLNGRRRPRVLGPGLAGVILPRRRERAAAPAAAGNTVALATPSANSDAA